MIERIKELLSDQELTAAAFADKLGVPRSTISHILSGRNKPSLEMVNKILDAFPDLRTEWLVRGEGLMYTYHTSPRQGDLFSQDQKGTAGNDVPAQNNEPPESSARVTKPYGTLPGKAPDSYTHPSGDQHEPGEASTAPGSANHGATNTESSSKGFAAPKSVAKIVILYRDGTFRDYVPEDA